MSQFSISYIKKLMLFGGVSALVCYPQNLLAQDNSFNQKIVQTQEKIEEGFAQLPNGQTLLLRPKVGRFIYRDDIYALKQNNRLYVSLAEMIDILELAINFDDQTKQGQGWFLREDWNIEIDLAAGQVTSKGQDFSVSPQDVIEEEGLVFVSQSDLAQWFGIELIANVELQFLEIESPYPLPAVARNFRQQKIKGSRKGANLAKLPREEIKYDWFDINTIDVRAGAQFRDLADSDPTYLTQGSLAFEGQALKHEAYALVATDNQERVSDTFAGIRSVVARLSKKSEDPDLLGPLKARSYAIGDTTITDLPLTGDAQQELGFRVSNSQLENTQFETTDINGDALPGWDIELFRNNILVDSLVVDDGGFYEFADVQLFPGNNLFELFFYGPQGEIRSQTVSVPVTRALLSSQNNTYDVSISGTETRTFQANRNEDPDKDTLHVAARFNKYFGNTLAYAGVRNRDVEGENKTFVGTGFTHLMNNTIFDGNFGIDDEANLAGQLTARQNIDDWNLSASALVQDEDYQPDETSDPKTLVLSANAQKSFLPAQGNRVNVFASGEYAERGDGDEQITGRLGTSYQKGRFNISNSLFYEEITPKAGEEDIRLDDTLSVRTHIGKFFVRGGVNYDIQPDNKVDRYFTQVNYRPNPDFSTDLTVSHQPERDFSEGRLSLNYTNDHFRTSPFLDIDSEREIIAGVNVNFSVVDTPENAVPLISSKRSIGRGLVSSFVYHDKNGNEIFDAGDEILPDVIVESLNIRRRAETNEKGYSLISDLPPTRATDIAVDDLTLPDPYMISATEGVSIFPSAGEITELQFPIHLSGEIDGSISKQTRQGLVQNIRRADVLLYPLDGKRQKVIKAQAAFDGFYVLSQVPPGEYLMTVANETLSKAKAGAPVPRIVKVGYEGDTLYGFNFELQEREAQVPVEVVYVDKSKANMPEFYLKTRAQNQRSQLLNLLGGIVQKNQSRDVFAGLQKVSDTQKTQNGQAAQNAQGIDIRYKTGSNNLEDAYEACRNLARFAVPCTLEVVVPVTGNIQTASR